MKTYKITIEKTTKELKLQTEWNKLHSKEEFDTKTDPQYGYIKEELPSTTRTIIYEQTTNTEIDLKAIIDAFNENI